MIKDIINLLSDIGINVSKEDIKPLNIKKELDKNKNNKKVTLNHVSDQKGIYFVIYNDHNNINIDKKCSIHKKENCPTKADTSRYNQDSLNNKLKKYNNETQRNNIIYIGKAEPTKNGLRQRIEQYLQTGKDKHGVHNGGKAIWQFEDINNLTLYYITENNLQKKDCKSISCLNIESELLKTFKDKYNTLPLANWRV